MYEIVIFPLIVIGCLFGWLYGRHTIKNIPKGYELTFNGRIFYYQNTNNRNIEK